MTRQERALRKTVVIMALALLLLVLLLIWSFSDGVFGSKEKRDGTRTVASIAGRNVTEKQWNEELRRRYGDEVLLQMVNRIAVEREADALGLTVSEAEVDRELQHSMSGYGSEEQYYGQMLNELGLTKEEIREETRYRLLLQAVATHGINVTDQEIDRYLLENGDRYRPRKSLELSIIMLASYEEADAVLDRLERGEDFAKLARELSIDEDSRKRDGRIGMVEEDDPFWPEEVLATAAGLSAGDIAGPLAMEDHYVIIRLESVTDPPVPDMETVRLEIRREIALEQAAPLDQVESELRAKYGASIEVDNRPED